MPMKSLNSFANVGGGGGRERERERISVFAKLDIISDVMFLETLMEF